MFSLFAEIREKSTANTTTFAINNNLYGTTACVETDNIVT